MRYKTRVMMCERLLEQAISRRVRQQAYRAKKGGGGQGSDGGPETLGVSEEVLAATGGSTAKKLFNTTTTETTSKSPTAKTTSGARKGEGAKVDETGEDQHVDDADLHVYEQQLQRALKRPQQYRVSLLSYRHIASTLRTPRVTYNDQRCCLSFLV